MPEEFYTQRDGCHSAYQYINSHSNAPTIVFLHGLGGDLDVWKPLVQHMRKHYSMNFLSIDLRGHGFSSKTFPHNKGDLYLYADDIASLIKQLNITSPIIVGHCFGGNVALVLAGITKLKAIITINTAPTINPLKIGALKITVNHMRFLFAPFQQKYRQVINRNGYHKDLNLWRIRDDIRRTGVTSYLFALNSFKNLRDFHSLDTNTPILAILGKNDLFVPLKPTEKKYRCLHHSTVTVVDDNHLIPLNQSPQNLAELLSHLLSHIGIHDLKS